MAPGPDRPRDKVSAFTCPKTGVSVGVSVTSALPSWVTSPGLLSGSQVTHLKQNWTSSLPLLPPPPPYLPEGPPRKPVGPEFAKPQLTDLGEAWVRILAPCLAAVCPGASPTLHLEEMCLQVPRTWGAQERLEDGLLRPSHGQAPWWAGGFPPMEAKPSRSHPGPADSPSSHSAYPVTLLLAGSAGRQPEPSQVPSVGSSRSPLARILFHFLILGSMTPQDFCHSGFSRKQIGALAPS